MGTYYGVRKVIENGKRVASFTHGQQPSFDSNEVLVGIINNGVWAIAPDLTRESEYRAFYDSYRQGNWLQIDFYRVPKDKIKDCPDEGRVDVEELELILKRN